MNLPGLYIHIPFCRQACYYCDFHFSTNLSYRKEMVQAMTREINIQSSYLEDNTLQSVYFGGGTPSILDIAQLERLLHEISSIFHIENEAEITLEANPDDLSPGKLNDLRALGINRLSIGIQSFNDRALQFLHRAHTADEALQSVDNARRAGFDNISIDLMFAVPGFSIETLKEDLRQAVLLATEHISIYNLTIEEKTVFGNWQKKGRLTPVDDDDSAGQFELIISTLEDKGYEQYEISNFCRDGHYAVHNSAYWKNTPYLGIGPGAHSYDGKNRMHNVANNHLYMKAIDKGVVPLTMEKFDKKSWANDYILTALRTKWGCDLKLLYEFSGYKLPESHEKEIEKMRSEGLLYLKQNKLFLTRKGRFLADSITAALFWV